MTNFRLHCVVCDNAMDYFCYLLKNYRDLASPNARIQVIAHCTDDESYHKIKAEKLADQVIAAHRRPEFYVYGNRVDVLNRIKLFFGLVPRLGGSSGHATGLNSIFSVMGGDDAIDIIADTDTVIVVPEWDVVIEKTLSTHDILATTYEAKGGASSGSGHIQTYKNRPNLTWAAVSPRLSLRDLDAGHMLWRTLPIRTAQQSEIFGLEIGDVLLRDVGWKVPKFLAEKKAKYLNLENIYPESGRCKILKAKNGYNEEYQLEGRPFILHQRGSRKHPFRSQPMSAPFYDAAEAYLESLKVQPEKLAVSG